MAELKQGRWVKIHEPGQANFTDNDNVMDIVIGQQGRCRAEATYTVRSYRKAAHWLREYLNAAEALKIIAETAMAQIQEAAENASRSDEEVTVSGDDWNCGIERMCDGSYKVQLNWKVDEPVTKHSKEKTTPKKRGRKKKGAS